MIAFILFLFIFLQFVAELNGITNEYSNCVFIDITAVLSCHALLRYR